MPMPRDRGHGGKVIVWADDATRFAGTISARGGARGGDGGLVEVSGTVLAGRGGAGRLKAASCCSTEVSSALVLLRTSIFQVPMRSM